MYGERVCNKCVANDSMTEIPRVSDKSNEVSRSQVLGYSHRRFLKLFDLVIFRLSRYISLSLNT